MLRSARALLLLIAGTFAPEAKAQSCGANAQSPISTDRPQVANSSAIVPCGSLQFENGMQETSSGGQQSYDLPETLMRYGLANKTELRLAGPDYFFNQNTASGLATGLGDLTLGLKQQLGLRPWGFEIAVIPAVSFPTGANAISSHGYDPTIQLPWSHGMGRSWTANGMFSVAWPTASGQRNVTGQPSIYFDRQLTPPWDVYVEYASTFPQRGGPQHIVGFGTTYKPTLHQQLDFHCSFGLSAATPDHMIGVGYSVRFQVVRAK